MSFNPKKLPPTVYKAYQRGSDSWTFVVRTAIEMKYHKYKHTYRYCLPSE